MNEKDKWINQIKEYHKAGFKKFVSGNQTNQQNLIELYGKLKGYEFGAKEQRKKDIEEFEKLIDELNQKYPSQNYGLGSKWNDELKQKLKQMEKDNE